MGEGPFRHRLSIHSGYGMLTVNERHCTFSTVSGKVANALVKIFEGTEESEQHVKFALPG